MEHPIAAQHDRLEALLSAVRAVLKSGDAGAASESLEQLRDAIDTHFGLEERLYFPTISALRPERKPTLQGFTDAHGSFRRLLLQIAHQQETDVDGARHAFEGFAESFALHEAAEEELLCSLEVELGCAP